MNNFVISEGNVDTEGSGLAQQFATPSGSSSFGNFDSERLSNEAVPTHRGGFDLNQFLQSLGVRQSTPNQGYAQLGAAVQQMLQGAQGGGMGFGGSGLTSGFDANWLSKQVNTASAQGQGI